MRSKILEKWKKRLSPEPEFEPKTLLELYERWLLELPSETINQIKGMKEKDVGGGMFNGMAMRNGLGLWTGSPLAQFFWDNDIWHADDMSGVIFACFHRYLNGKPLKVAKEAKYYKKYWEKTRKGLHNENKKGALAHAEKWNPEVDTSRWK